MISLINRFRTYDKVSEGGGPGTFPGQVLYFSGQFVGKSVGSTEGARVRLCRISEGLVTRCFGSSYPPYIYPFAEVCLPTLVFSACLMSGVGSLTVQGAIIGFNLGVTSSALGYLRAWTSKRLSGEWYFTHQKSDLQKDRQVDQIISKVWRVVQYGVVQLIFKFQRNLLLAESIAKGAVAILSYPFFSTKESRVEQIAAIASMIFQLVLYYFIRNIHVIIMAASVVSHVISGIAICHLTNPQHFPWITQLRKSLSTKISLFQELEQHIQQREEDIAVQEPCRHSEYWKRGYGTSSANVQKAPLSDFRFRPAQPSA